MTASLIVQPRMTVLTAQQLKQVHNFSLEILSRVGIRVDSSQALSYFTAATGAQINGDRVKISPDLVDWALKSAPSSFDIYDRDGHPAFRAGDGRAHFGVGVTNLFYQDPQTDKLTGFTREHMAIGTRLSHTLPAYDLVSTIGIISDVTRGTEDLYAVLEMAANTTKPLVILNSDPKQFTSSLNLLEHLRENLSEKPFVIPYFNPVTPLIINRETGDKMIAAIERGLPLPEPWRC
jgi:trimethylamine--corrinoid protein Co-methyltransferase